MGRRNINKDELEKFMEKKKAKDPRKFKMDIAFMNQVCTDLDKYFERHKHLLYKPTLKEILGPEFVQQKPVTALELVKERHESELLKNRDRHLEFIQRWKKYQEERDSKQEELVQLCKCKMQLRRLIILSTVFKFVEHLKIMFTQIKAKSRLRKIVVSVAFRFILYRATLRRYGWPRSWRHIHSKIIPSLSFLANMHNPGCRIQAGKLLHQMMLDLKYRKKMLKFFNKFEKSIMFIQGKIRMVIEEREFRYKYLCQIFDKEKRYLMNYFSRKNVQHTPLAKKVRTKVLMVSPQVLKCLLKNYLLLKRKECLRDYVLNQIELKGDSEYYSESIKSLNLLIN